MTVISATLTMGDKRVDGGSCTNSGKSGLILVEIQILIDMKGSSKCYPDTGQMDGRSRGSLG